MNLDILLTSTNFSLVLMVGMLFGLAELLSRFSEPQNVFKIRAGIIYLLFNGILAILSYGILIYTKETNSYKEHIDLINVIIAGTASTLIIRSSFVQIKIKDKPIDIGLHALIQIFLDVIERAYDKKRAEIELCRINEIMKNVNFIKAVESLPGLCLSIMQSLTDEEVKKYNIEIDKLSKTSIGSNLNNSLLLGITISKYVGIDVLENAKKKLRSEIELEEKNKQELDVDFWLKKMQSYE